MSGKLSFLNQKQHTQNILLPFPKRVCSSGMRVMTMGPPSSRSNNSHSGVFGVLHPHPYPHPRGQQVQVKDDNSRRIVGRSSSVGQSRSAHPRGGHGGRTSSTVGLLQSQSQSQSRNQNLSSTISWNKNQEERHGTLSQVSVFTRRRQLVLRSNLSVFISQFHGRTNQDKNIEIVISDRQCSF